jgi:hypothetical protein
VKVFLIFLLAVFFTASRSRAGDGPRHALPLFVACVVVTTALASLRFAS